MPAGLTAKSTPSLVVPPPRIFTHCQGGEFAAFDNDVYERIKMERGHKNVSLFDEHLDSMARLKGIQPHKTILIFIMERPFNFGCRTSTNSCNHRESRHRQVRIPLVRSTICEDAKEQSGLVGASRRTLNPLHQKPLENPKSFKRISWVERKVNHPKRNVGLLRAREPHRLIEKRGCFASRHTIRLRECERDEHNSAR